MSISQNRSRRKPSGGRFKTTILKKIRELGRLPAMTKVGERKLKSIRVKGGNVHHILQSGNQANLIVNKKAVKAKIESVLENAANRDYVRRNVMTKGTIIKTDKGKAKITSRPGQDGIINAVLVP